MSQTRTGDALVGHVGARGWEENSTLGTRDCVSYCNNVIEGIPGLKEQKGSTEVTVTGGSGCHP